jgi:ATP-dependent exoDNAse (exonuclease V) alpha subunit
MLDDIAHALLRALSYTLARWLSQSLSQAALDPILLFLGLAALAYLVYYLLHVLNLAYVSRPANSPRAPSQPGPPASVPPRAPVGSEQEVASPTGRTSSQPREPDLRQSTYTRVLSGEQKRVLSILEREQAQPYFVTGPAGSGKSTLLRTFYEKRSHEALIVAPTGVAALNIGGQTIHRVFGFPPRLLRLRDSRDIPVFNADSPRRKLLEATRYIIVDEISMVRVDTLDAIDWSLRLNRDRREPFGGVRFIAFGDVMQLEPVIATRGEREYIRDTWGSQFFFDAKVWREIPLMVVELEGAHRQRGDPEFVDLLGRLRRGDVSVVRRLNERVDERGGERSEVVILTPRRKEAEQINAVRLGALPGREYRYEASVDGRFAEDELPAERVLIIKRGAQVMLLRNAEEYVNGDVGVVEEADTDGIVVRLKRGGRVTVREATWEKIEYEYDRNERKIVPRVVGWFRQLPVRLAWAVTIHKSQGLTLDAVHVELGRGMFAHGQLYVALTRARSLRGLTLSRPVAEADLIWERRAVQFEEWCKEGKLWRGSGT